MLMKFGCSDGQRAETHQRADRRRVGELHEFAQLLRRIRRDDAAARVHQRALGFPDHLRRAPDLAGVALREHLVARAGGSRSPA